MRFLILVMMVSLVMGTCGLYADVVYEGDLDPVTEQFWSLDSGLTGSHSTDGDILTVTDSGSAEYRFTMGANLDATVGWTMEVRARNVSGPSGEGRIVLIPDGTYDEGLIMGDGGTTTARLRYKTSPVTVSVDTTQFHVYRITRSGTNVALYVDGALEDSGTNDHATSNRYLRMGSGSGSSTGTVEIDYVYLWTSGAYAPGTEPALNPLLNGGFEAFYGSGADEYATGWEPWGSPAPLDYVEENIWVRSGESSQRMNDFNYIYDGGLRQRIPVTPGKVVTFSCWFNHYFVGEEDVFYQVGIDPDGDSDVAGTQWSGIVMSSDSEWLNLSVQAKATGDAMMLYTRGYITEVTGPTERSVFFDDAEVEIGEAFNTSVDGGWELYQ